jgi:predicted nucleic acid-binding protein
VTVPVAVLDACVLYPQFLRDFMLSLAHVDLYRPRWSDEIQREWSAALRANRPDIPEDHIARTIARMNEAFPGASVTGYEKHLAALSLPDTKDIHVLAAAIEARASIIITNNLDDFPEEVLEPHGITPLHPDKAVMCFFGVAALEGDRDSFWLAVREMRERLRHPPYAPDEFVAALERSGLPRVSALMRQHMDRF